MTAAGEIRRILPFAGRRDAIVKPAVSNHAVLTSAIVRVFPSFEHAIDVYKRQDMLMVAKYFERIGDHATNIAEWVIYSITGEHEK